MSAAIQAQTAVDRRASAEKISARALAARHACADWRGREHLACVRAEPDGGFVATDGHMLVSLRSEAFATREEALSFDVQDVQAAHKVGRAMKSADVELSPLADPAAFPDWRRVVPSDAVTARIQLDARLLARAFAAVNEFHALKPSAPCPLVFEIRGELDPVVIRSAPVADEKNPAIEGQALALVMPMRP